MKENDIFVFTEKEINNIKFNDCYEKIIGKVFIFDKDTLFCSDCYFYNKMPCPKTIYDYNNYLCLSSGVKIPFTEITDEL